MDHRSFGRLLPDYTRKNEKTAANCRLLHSVKRRRSGVRSSSSQNQQQQQRDQHAASRRRSGRSHNFRLHGRLGGAAGESGGSSQRQGGGESEFLHINLQLKHPAEISQRRTDAPKTVPRVPLKTGHRDDCNRVDGDNRLGGHLVVKIATPAGLLSVHAAFFAWSGVGTGVHRALRTRTYISRT